MPTNLLKDSEIGLSWKREKIRQDIKTKLQSADQTWKKIYDLMLSAKCIANTIIFLPVTSLFSCHQKYQITSKQEGTCCMDIPRSDR